MDSYLSKYSENFSLENEFKYRVSHNNILYNPLKKIKTKELIKLTPYSLKKSNLKIVIIGTPGGGKGYIANHLKKAFSWKKYQIIDCSKVIRSGTKNNTRILNKIQDYMQQGKLIDNNLVIDLMMKVLYPLNDKGYIMTGFPRTIEQARVLFSNKWGKIKPDVIIVLDRKKNLVIEYTMGRCKCICGIKYHPVYKIPPESCISKLKARKDDNIDVINRRYDEYIGSISSIKDILSQNVDLKLFDTSKNMYETMKDILNFLNLVFLRKNNPEIIPSISNIKLLPPPGYHLLAKTRYLSVPSLLDKLSSARRKLLIIQRHGNVKVDIVLQAMKQNLLKKIKEARQLSTKQETDEAIHKGIVNWNTYAKKYNWLDDYLTKNGVKKAKAVGRELGKILVKHGVSLKDIIAITSPLRRAVQTQHISWQNAVMAMQPVSTEVLGDDVKWLSRDCLAMTKDLKGFLDPQDPSEYLRHSKEMIPKWFPLLDVSNTANTSRGKANTPQDHSDPPTIKDYILYGRDNNYHPHIKKKITDDIQDFILELKNFPEKVIWITTHKRTAEIITEMICGKKTSLSKGEIIDFII